MSLCVVHVLTPRWLLGSNYFAPFFLHLKQALRYKKKAAWRKFFFFYYYLRFWRAFEFQPLLFFFVYFSSTVPSFLLLFSFLLAVHTFYHLITSRLRTVFFPSSFSTLYIPGIARKMYIFHYFFFLTNASFFKTNKQNFYIIIQYV